MALWFYGCLVLWLNILWFLGFKNISNVHCMFLIDLDPISKISEILLNGSSGFPVLVFSKTVNMWDFQNVEIWRIIYFKDVPIFSYICWNISLSSKRSEHVNDWSFFGRLLGSSKNNQKILQYIRKPKLAILE